MPNRILLTKKKEMENQYNVYVMHNTVLYWTV